MAVTAVAGLASVGGQALGAYLAGTAFTMGMAMSAFAIGAGMSMVSRALMPKPDAGVGLEGLQNTVRNPVSSRKMVYGEMRTGGTIVYIQTDGTDNKYLHMAIVWATHEVESIDEIYFNEEVIWKSSSLYQGLWGNYVTHNNYLGTQTTSDPLLDNAFVTWTADHKLEGVAYTSIRMEWNADQFQNGIPTITAKIKGKKVLDPRTSTTAFSKNPALCLYDYMRDSAYGLGEDAANFNTQSVIDAANICDETDTQFTGARYELNGVLDTANKVKENIEALTSAMAGHVAFSGGEFFIYAGAYRTPFAQAFDETHLVGDIQLSTKQSRRSLYNAVKGVFVSSGDDYIATDYPAQISSTYSVEDGDPIYLDMPLPFTTEQDRAQRLAKIALLRSRQQKVITMPMNMAALQFKAGDTIKVTNEKLGFTNKVFEVIGYDIRVGDQIIVDVQAIETDAGLYDWTTSDEQPYVFTGETPNYDGTPVAPTSLQLNSYTHLQADGTHTVYVDSSWTASTDAFVDFYRFKYTVDGVSTSVDTRDTSHRFIATSGSQYSVSVTAHNLLGRESTALTDTITPVADTNAPSDPASVTATGGVKSIELTWDNPSDADFKHVEIYYTTDTNFTPNNWTPQDDGTASLAKVDGESFILGGLTAGDQYKFWLRSVDFTGNKSAYASRAEAVGTAIATPAGDIDVSNINTSDLNNDAGFVDADGAAAAAPVQSVAGLTGSVLVADIITEGALIVSGDNISDLTNDAGYTTFDANDVEAAIANNVTVIDGAKITTGTVAAARLDVAGLINTQKLAVNYELDLNSSGVKTVTITDYSISVNGANGWDTDVYSTQSYKGKCIARGTIKVKNAYYMFGINTDPLANDSYSSLDFSVYCDYGTLRIYESGTDRGTFGSLAIGDTLEVIYADGYVKYYQNGTEKRSVAVSGDPEFYFDSSFYSGGNVVYVEDVYFGQGGVAITPDAIYQGAGHWNNADTGFYLDKDGRFSLDNKLSFDPSSDTLRVDGLIEAVNLTVTGEAKFANVTADNVKVGSITYDMLSGEVKNAFQADIAVSTGGTVGDFQEDSGIIPSTVDLPVFSHGSKPVEITLTASKTGYHYVDYTTAQRTATYTVQRATDAAFTANLQTIGTGSIIVSAYDISGYYGGSSTVFYHAVNFSVLITDDPSLGDYYYRVTFSAGSAFSDSNIQVTANLAANEAASGVVSSGGNADTLDNLDSTKFMRTDENTGTTGNLQVGGDLSVTGDLNITGNINSYNVTDLEVTDTSITLNAGGAALTADGAGIYIEKAVNSTTDASITWDATNDRWLFSHNIFGTISSATNASEAYFLDVKDTRAAQLLPSDVPEYKVSAEFTNQITSGWHGALNVKGWHDGYSTWQLIGGNDTVKHDNLYFRSGVGSTWGSLNRIWHSGDFSSTDLSNWNVAYGWGDHDGLYLPIGGGSLTGDTSISGDLTFTGTATTTNQSYGIFWTGFDKEGTTDFSDNAYIIHTVNSGGHSGSVLLISSQNDAGDGIAFSTHASSRLKHNSYNIWTEKELTTTNKSNYDTAYTYSQVGHLPLAGGTMTGNVKFTLGTSNLMFESDTNSGFIPYACQYRQDGTVTGAIKIEMPDAVDAPDDMITMWVDIMDYASGESVSVYIAGYNYTTSSTSTYWYNTTAMVLSPRSDRQYKVTWGYESGRKYVAIGETTSTWNDMGVVVRDVQLTYRADVDQYPTDWDIDIVTTLGGVDESKTATYPYAYPVDNTNEVKLGGIKIGGASSAENYISFYGTTGDQNGNYNHSYIGERIYDGTEKSELVIAKYNDVEGASGSDRVRVIGNNFQVDTYTAAITPAADASLETAATTGTYYTRFKVRQNGDIEIGGSKFSDSSRNLTNIGSISATGDITGATLKSNNATALQMYGGGSGTYNQGVLYCNSTNLVLEAPLVTDSASAARVPIRISWRGGYASKGGIEIGDGYTAVNSLKIGTTTVIDSSRNLTNIGTLTANSGNFVVNSPVANTTVVRGYSDQYHGMQFRGYPNGTGASNFVAADVMSFFEYGGDFRFYKRTPSALILLTQLTDGNIVTTGDVTAYGSPSDETLKENIELIDNAIDKVKQLRGVTFNYIGDDNKMTGLIAQDLQKVLPEVVYTTEDEKLAVRYGNTVGLLVEAIKEQQNEIDELKALVKQLLEK